MASKRLHTIVAIIIVAVLPAIALATEYVVGDKTGWTNNNFDYQAWAAGKTFKVGDKIVFRYPVGIHNVFKVNGTAFQDCIVPNSNDALTSGNDTVPLATPGRKWYICGVGQHCKLGGQKLAITVQSDSPAPALPPNGGTPAAESPNSANGIVVTLYQALMVGVAAVAVMMMV